MRRHRRVRRRSPTVLPVGLDKIAACPPRAPRMRSSKASGGLAVTDARRGRETRSACAVATASARHAQRLTLTQPATVRSCLTSALTPSDRRPEQVASPNRWRRRLPGVPRDLRPISLTRSAPRDRLRSIGDWNNLVECANMVLGERSLIDSASWRARSAAHGQKPSRRARLEAERGRLLAEVKASTWSASTFARHLTEVGSRSRCPVAADSDARISDAFRPIAGPKRTTIDRVLAGEDSRPGAQRAGSASRTVADLEASGRLVGGARQGAADGSR